MKHARFSELIKQPEYDFLRTNEHLGDKIIMLCLGGSYAYGTNTETSDVDIRGIALNTKKEILLSRPFEQVMDSVTDTVVYSFSKIMKLLTDANPNVLEMLYLDPDQYLFLSRTGEELIENRDMFLSKKVLYTFGGYARAQLSRLDNKVMRNQDQAGQELHILRSIQNASETFSEKYFRYPEDAIKLYIDASEREDMQTEVFMDINLHHYPLRDYKCMWSEMNNIVKDYGKIGKRAKNAILHNKVNKHAMHLYRLLDCAIEALEKGTFSTHRKQSHDVLMSIRNGDFMDENGQMSNEFFRMIDDMEKRMETAAATSKLPDRPDYKRIDEFICRINAQIVNS